LSFVANFTFYIVLFLKKFRLNPTLHWFLCNFTLSEILRNSALLVWSYLAIDITVKQGEDFMNAYHRDQNENVTLNLQLLVEISTIVHYMAVMEFFLYFCAVTSQVFAFLVMMQFFFTIKNIFYKRIVEGNTAQNSIKKSMFIITSLTWIGPFSWYLSIYIYGKKTFTNVFYTYQ